MYPILENLNFLFDIKIKQKAKFENNIICKVKHKNKHSNKKLNFF